MYPLSPLSSRRPTSLHHLGSPPSPPALSSRFTSTNRRFPLPPVLLASLAFFRYTPITPTYPSQTPYNLRIRLSSPLSSRPYIFRPFPPLLSHSARSSLISTTRLSTQHSDWRRLGSDRVRKLEEKEEKFYEKSIRGNSQLDSGPIVSMSVLSMMTD